MDQYVPAAQRPAAASSGDIGAPELDASTWGAESVLQALIEYQVESVRFVARRA